MISFTERAPVVVKKITQSWSWIQQNLSFNTDPNIDREFIHEWDKTFWNHTVLTVQTIFKTTVGVGLLVL